MTPFQEDMDEFQKQLKKGNIKEAYRGLIEYVMNLRTYFSKKYPDYCVSGSIYQGYMDMTYFALFPSSLKQLDLKIAIVFNYEAFKFEAWLAARNRKVQRHYWELFKDSHWEEYRLVAPAAGIDSILECDLAKDFDIGNPVALTSRIETATSAFIDNIERFLSNHQIHEDVNSAH
ncbi:MAG TPA: hypothetical protein HA260_03440 [Thermoplasmata archaeon]|nr:hypothetical protein [Thermoplasmata archaeon]